MHRSRPVGADLNGSASNSPGKSKLKAHLVACPTNNPAVYNRTTSDDSPSSINTSTNRSKDNSRGITTAPTSARFPPRPNAAATRSSSSISKASMLITVPHQTNSPAGTSSRFGETIAPSKPAAPLPIRKHHTMSPPIHLQATVHQSAQNPSSLNATSDLSRKLTNTNSKMIANPTLSQATVVRAPSFNTNAMSNQPAGTVSVYANSGPDRSSTDNHDPRGSSKMTLTELRSFAERQRQLLAKQTQQLQAKEERLAWLRSARAQMSEEASDIPPPGASLSLEQEKCLHKLRNLRGQTEQLRLNNEQLVCEVDALSRSVTAKEIELEACRLRVEQATKSLSIIDKCYNCLSTGTSSRTYRSALNKTDAANPLKAWSPHLPFASEKDTKRWHDGLLEAERLDRQITLAMNHTNHTRRRHRPVDSAVQPPSTSGTADERVQKPAENPIAPPTSHSDFTSALYRTSSPPTNRRSSLRMLLHAAAAAGDSRTISCFSRLKTPPRYASRAVINDMYMRKICMESVEKYKKTANEIYWANVERMQARQRQLLSDSDKSSSGDAAKADDHLEPGEVPLNDKPHGRLPTFHRPLSPADSVSSSSSSSSSLELVGIEQTVSDRNVSTVSSPVGEETKLTTGDVDSGLGGSDDTGPLEHNAASSSNTTKASHNVDVYLDDNAGTDANLSNASFPDGNSRSLKSILRKSHGKAPSEPNDSSTEQSSSRSVRFHPLALLLDAALEGDLELVKEVVSLVSDVSEPNDEGITALHNAVCAGRTEIAEFLVRIAGADVNAGDTDGWTPLHCAASCGNLPLARLLVEHGASLHARTLSDQETPLEKCDQGDEEAECEEYLFFQQERLGSAASGIVYALFPRGLKSAGPGSPDAHLQPDELEVYPNELLKIVNREPAGETEWMLAEKSNGTRGLIPRSHISCYPLVRVPPASRPIPVLPRKPPSLIEWEDEGDEDEVVDPPSEGTTATESPSHVIEVELPDSETVEFVDGSAQNQSLPQTFVVSLPAVHLDDQPSTELSDLKTAL